MKNTSLSTLLIPLLAALAIYFPLAGTSPATEPSAAKATTAAAVTLPPSPTPVPGASEPGMLKGAAKLLCEFFGKRPAPKGAQEGAPSQESLQANELLGKYCYANLPDGKRLDNQVEFLIATVPDPKESRSAYLFDRHLNAMQRAIEVAGYIFDRYWLPWEKTKAAPAPQSSAGAPAEPRYLSEPGIVLFRRLDNPPSADAAKNGSHSGTGDGQFGPSLLVVFLVGETPTTGIHKTALRNALDQIKFLSPLSKFDTAQRDGTTPSTCNPSAGDGSAACVRIMGPAFSGSAVSLALGLKGWLEENKDKFPAQVRVISGSAMTVAPEEFINLTGHPGQVRFAATIIPNQAAQDAFIRYLIEQDNSLRRDANAYSDNDNQKAPRTRIALLTESNTGYGQAAISQIRENNKKALQPVPARPTPSQTSQSTRRQPQGPGAASPCPSPSPSPATALPLRVPILSLTFPLHIAQLRAEMAKNKNGRSEAPNVLNGKSNLALPMEESSDAQQETISPFTSLEAVSSELVMGEILSSIERQQIRYVGLSSSDVRDRIFLAREVRAHCPNAVIFTLNSDMLFLHSEANLDLQGTLLITTYPLFNLNQLWSYPFSGDQARAQFTFPGAQGWYNATLALLRQEKRMLEYASPFTQYDAGGTRQPALWLGIIGRDRLWPLRTLPVSLSPESGGAGGSYVFSSEANPAPTPSPSPSPCTTVGAEATPAPQSAEPNPLPRLGLGTDDYSPLSLGFLLLIAFFCLLLPALLLLQLVLFRSRRSDRQPTSQGDPEVQSDASHSQQGAELLACPEANAEAPRGFGRGIGNWLSELSVVRWLDQGWFGRVFSDQEFYRYRLERRVYLMGCCVSLLAVSFWISNIALIRSQIERRMKAESVNLATEANSHLLLNFVALVVFILAVTALIWLVGSVVLWIKQSRKYFQGRAWTIIAVGIAGIVVGLVLFELAELHWRPAREQVFFVLRATDLASGVSPLLPVMLIGLAAFIYALSAVRRLNLAERMTCLCHPRQPELRLPTFLDFEHDKTRSFGGLKNLEERLKDLITCHTTRVSGTWPCAVLLGVIYWKMFFSRFVPSVEGPYFDWFFSVIFFVVPLLFVWSFLRFIWMWTALRKVLRRLSWHPLFADFAASWIENKRFRSLPQFDLTTPAPTYTAITLAARQARQFYQLLDASPENKLADDATQADKEIASFANKSEDGAGSVDKDLIRRIRHSIQEAENALSQSLAADAQGNWQEALQKRLLAQSALCELAQPVTTALEQSWLLSSVEPQAEKDKPAPSDWRQEAKFFLLTHVTAFLQHIFAHLQNLVAMVTAGLLLVLLASNSYPFQPRQPLLIFSWVTILTVVAVTLLIFVQMSRDRVLSLLTGTTPGQVNVTRDFVLRVLVHGVIPIVALLGAQFPETLRQIVSWVGALQGGGH